MVELKSFGLETSQGPYLLLNEDIAEVDLSNKLFILLDGIGGSSVGDQAARSIKECLLKTFTKIARDSESTLPFYYNHKYLLETNALINSFYLAHQNITKENSAKTISKRGGASAIAIAVSDRALSVISTGSCSGYLLRNNRLQNEIIPDSLAQYTSQINYGHSFIPLSGIGIFETLSYSVREFKLYENDLYFFCTDGGNPLEANDELRNVLIANKNKEILAIRKIFELSNRLGNLDNQSAIIIQF